VALHMKKVTCTCQKCGVAHIPYEGVSLTTKLLTPLPYMVRVEDSHIGCFDTALEAAVCYARFTRIAAAEGHAEALAQCGKGDEPAPARKPEPEVVVLSDEHVRQLAEAEGLALLLSKKAPSGFTAVQQAGRGLWRACATINGKAADLGLFGSAMEASLAVARHRAAQAAQAPPPPAPAPAMTLAEAEQLAEAEGLTLLRDPRSLTGFRGVCESRQGTFTSYSRDTERKVNVHLGTFRSAPEAALNLARHLGVEACEAAALKIGIESVRRLHAGGPMKPRSRPAPGLKRMSKKRAREEPPEELQVLADAALVAPTGPAPCKACAGKKRAHTCGAKGRKNPGEAAMEDEGEEPALAPPPPLVTLPPAPPPMGAGTGEAAPRAEPDTAVAHEEVALAEAPGSDAPDFSPAPDFAPAPDVAAGSAPDDERHATAAAALASREAELRCVTDELQLLRAALPLGH